MPVPDQIFYALFGDLSQALLAEAGKFPRQAPALRSVGPKPFTTWTVEGHCLIIGCGKKNLRTKFDVPGHAASIRE
jgi:hypothetical protein